MDPQDPRPKRPSLFAENEPQPPPRALADVVERTPAPRTRRWTLHAAIAVVLLGVGMGLGYLMFADSDRDRDSIAPPPPVESPTAPAPMPATPAAPTQDDPADRGEAPAATAPALPDDISSEEDALDKAFEIGEARTDADGPKPRASRTPDTEARAIDDPLSALSAHDAPAPSSKAPKAPPGKPASPPKTDTPKRAPPARADPPKTAAPPQLPPPARPDPQRPTAVATPPPKTTVPPDPPKRIEAPTQPAPSAPAPKPAPAATASPATRNAPVESAPVPPARAAPTRNTPQPRGGAPKAISTPAPRYPPEALRAATVGEVTVEFTITADGSVADVRVLKSRPARVFDREAISAVRRWRFEPPGAPVTLRRTFGFKP